MKNIDVTVLHPSSSQTLAAGSPNNPGVAAKRSERSKRRKYNRTESLVPIALAVGGYSGQETRSLIRTICKNTPCAALRHR
eukprot:525873-Amphidinium_carterae.1